MEEAVVALATTITALEEGASTTDIKAIRLAVHTTKASKEMTEEETINQREEPTVETQGAEAVVFTTDKLQVLGAEETRLKLSLRDQAARAGRIAV